MVTSSLSLPLRHLDADLIRCNFLCSHNTLGVFCRPFSSTTCFARRQESPMGGNGGRLSRLAVRNHAVQISPCYWEDLPPRLSSLSASPEYGLIVQETITWYNKPVKPKPKYVVLLCCHVTFKLLPGKWHSGGWIISHSTRSINQRVNLGTQLMETAINIRKLKVQVYREVFFSATVRPGCILDKTLMYSMKNA